MSRPAKSVLAEVTDILAELDRRADADKLSQYYPDIDTPKYHCRDKYPKHLDVFRRGAEEGVVSRLFMAANGVGKTELLIYEACCHLRGWYPDWWEGRRFNRPVDMWLAGKTSQSVRDIIQLKMFGKPYEEGTGIMPKVWVDLASIARSGVPGAIDTVRIKRATGGHSYLGFKSYQQGVAPFFGPEKDFIGLDEPPPADIYSECVARTRNREGACVLITLAPKEGNTETVRLFLGDPHPSRVLVTCGWADVPHLAEEWKIGMRASTPPYLRDATEFGIPGRGAGAVYPVPEEDITCDTFAIPKHWRWLWSIDTGYHNTAVGWFAIDPDADVMYLVSCYKDGGAGTDIPVHATRILARHRAYGFLNMPGVGDAAAISTTDGAKVIDEYRKHGLTLKLASKAVNAGVGVLLGRMNTGRFKVFRTCTQWFEEFRSYSYREQKEDNEPTIVKINDHLMDMTRYASMECEGAASISKPTAVFQELKW